MVHGTNRNADHYFATATAAAFLAGRAREHGRHRAAYHRRAGQAASRTRSCGRIAATVGARAACRRRIPTLSAFDFMDEILRKLANKKVFPNLTKIVVAGHSAGGQFVTRYEMANKVHGTLGERRSRTSSRTRRPMRGRRAVRPLPTGNADPAAAKDGSARPERREGELEFHLRSVRRGQGAELRQVAGGARESQRATRRR